MTQSQKFWAKEIAFLVVMTALIFWFIAFGGAEQIVSLFGGHYVHGRYFN